MYECPKCKALVGDYADECFNCHTKLDPQKHEDDKREEEKENEWELRQDFKRRRIKAYSIIAASFVLFLLITGVTANLNIDFKVVRIILIASSALIFILDMAILIIFKPNTCPFCGFSLGKHPGSHCKWCGKQVRDWF